MSDTSPFSPSCESHRTRVEDATLEAAAVMAAIGALLEGALAPFLARQAEELLPLLLSPAVLAAPGTSSGQESALARQASSLRQLLAERIPPRLLMGSLPGQVIKGPQQPECFY